MPLGSSQKGSYDVTGAVVELVSLHSSVRSHSPTDSVTGSNSGRKNNPEWVLRVKSPLHNEAIELGVETKEEAIDWCNTIKYSNNRLSN